jgi:hypothetical protein
MFSLTRILTLAAASALVALTAAGSPARAEEPAQGRHKPILTTDECHLQRRAISRRACQARLSDEMHIDTAENK